MNAPTTNQTSGSSSASTTHQHTSPSQQPVAAVAPTQQGTTGSTDPYLQDFTLLAEAAKRAQVAVMVRDFEDCAL
ncbi:uncharacterized protein J7T54_006448 [Emericellopsis cladophorae]|uniref:Thiol methyltransferase n=1 Tax=Emericellopsis cladophorae TaxID=2686198 RepID=A0A9P9Y7B2_9HYPO|nr:uncharacterized protein J7T54_006448 [Emericellopsis cladophorae]KAI6784403.1 hypothetical protein J7T54_006448 [Emericellopsis cladophorae]